MAQKESVAFENAANILHKRYIGNDAERKESLEGERTKDKAERLVDAHWEYIKGVLTHGGIIAEPHLTEIEFHYKTSMVHGYGHGWEDCEKAKLKE